MEVKIILWRTYNVHNVIEAAYEQLERAKGYHHTPDLNEEESGALLFRL